MFCSPGRVFLTVFGYQIYYYGILMGTAIIVAVVLANYISKKDYQLDNKILDISPSILLSGIIGARFYYCLTDLQFYYKHPLEILDFRNGGLSIHGAILFGAIALFIECKRHKLDFWKLCDIFAITLPLAQAIGRWGNFFNSEAFGLPTNLPWKLYIPIESRPEQYINSSYFHPTFLYESILDFIIFLILYFGLKNKYKNQPGIISAIYLISYSIVRICIESIRIDCKAFILGIPIPIFISLIIILFSTGFLIYKHKVTK